VVHAARTGRLVLTGRTVAGGLAAALVVLLGAPVSAGAASWIAAWGAAPTGSATGGPRDATVRDLVRVSVGGKAIRIRVANAQSTDTPLVIGAASVAVAKAPGSAELVAGTSRPITFGGGHRSVTLPPGTAFLYSDPIALPVTDHEDLAIDLSLPTAEPGALTATWNESFATADGAGDVTGQASASGFSPGASSSTFTLHPGVQLPLNCDGCATYAVTAVDVLTDEAGGTVVGLGSSTFHGYGSDQDGWDSVLDDLALRVDRELPSGHRSGVVNAGISGDTLHAGLTRAARDAFSQSGVTGIVVYDLNDIAPPASRTAEQVEADYRTLIAQSHARGIRVYCPTWAPDASLTTPTDERGRINTWILTSGACDGVVDWDAVLRDPLAPPTFRPDYFSDSMHPNPAGHRAIAAATPIGWFASTPGTAAGGEGGTVGTGGTTGAGGGANGLPSTRACVSRRTFTIHPRAPRGQTLRSARVFVNGKLVASPRGRHLHATIDLRGLPKGSPRVTLVLRTRSGRTYVRTRIYRTCAARSRG